jgi:hypothetical protein
MANIFSWPSSATLAIFGGTQPGITWSRGCAARMPVWEYGALSAEDFEQIGKWKMVRLV